MPGNFEGHATTDYKGRWLYFTVQLDKSDYSYYVELFDRQGKDVESDLPSFPTKREANAAAVAYIQEREAKGREISPEI